MQSLFKSIFHGGKTAGLSPPAEVHAEVPVEVHAEIPADLSLAPPKSSSAQGAATAAAPTVAPSAAPSTQPAANDEAVLQDFLLKNFLFDDPPAQPPAPPPVFPPNGIKTRPSIQKFFPKPTPKAPGAGGPHANLNVSSGANSHV